MSTNTVKIYLDPAKKYNHDVRKYDHKFSRTARSIGFKDATDAARTAETAELLNDTQTSNALYQFFDAIRKPILNPNKKRSDVKRVREVQGFGFTKSEARKYLRHGVFV